MLILLSSFVQEQNTHNINIIAIKHFTWRILFSSLFAAYCHMLFNIAAIIIYISFNSVNRQIINSISPELLIVFLPKALQMEWYTNYAQTARQWFFSQIISCWVLNANYPSPKGNGIVTIR